MKINSIEHDSVSTTLDDFTEKLLKDHVKQFVDQYEEKTDLERLKETLNAIGCGFKEFDAVDEYKVGVVKRSEVKYNYVIQIHGHDGIGYINLWINFYFLNGKFQATACLE